MYILYRCYVNLPLSLRATLPLRCVDVSVQYRRIFTTTIELAGWLRRLRVGIVMQRSGVRSPAKAYKRFRALLPRISSVSSLNLTHTISRWLTKMVGPAWSSLVFIPTQPALPKQVVIFSFFKFFFHFKKDQKGQYNQFRQIAMILKLFCNFFHLSFFVFFILKKILTVKRLFLSFFLI